MKNKLTYFIIFYLLIAQGIHAQYLGGAGSGHSYSCNDTILCSAVANITGTDSICVGTVATFTASGGQTYSWNTGASTSSLNVSPAINTVYTVTVSQGICFDIDSFSVTVKTLLVSLSGTDTICNGANATITASGGQSYSWNTGATTSSLNVSPTINTVYTVTVSDGACSITDTFSVSVENLLAVISGIDSICIGTNATITASGGQNYLWNTGATTATVNVSPTTNTIYTVTVSQGACSGTGTFSVSIKNIAVAVSGNTSICNGASTSLSASGANNYSWSPSGGLSSTSGSIITISTTVPTTYTLIAWDNQGCYDTSFIAISIDSSADASIFAAGPFCENSAPPFQLSAVDPGGTWSGNGIINASTGIFSPPVAGAGTHQIIYTISGNCGDADTINIIVYAKPVADAGPNITITNGASVTLNGSGGTTYSWSPSAGLNCNTCSSPVATPTETTTYYVTVTDSNGCTDTDTITITVEIECDELFVPNAFSPNNDLQNDYLFVLGGNCIKTMVFIIYDRWGTKIFESHSMLQGWDGTFNGKKLNTDVFVYTLTAELRNGEDVFMNGNISLVR